MKASEVLKNKKKLKEERLKEKQTAPVKLTFKHKEAYRKKSFYRRVDDEAYRSSIINSAYGSIQQFAEDALNGEMNYATYEVERGVFRELPAIILSDGDHQNAADGFDLCIEYTSQILRFTQDTRINDYEKQRFTNSEIVRHLIYKPEEPIDKADLKTLKAFVDYSKDIAMKAPLEAVERVIEEITNVTKPHVARKSPFTFEMIRQWLVDLDR